MPFVNADMKISLWFLIFYLCIFTSVRITEQLPTSNMNQKSELIFGPPLGLAEFQEAVAQFEEGNLSSESETDEFRPYSAANLHEGDIAGVDNSERPADASTQHFPVAEEHQLWPNGIVPFKLSETFNKRDRHIIAAAMKEIEKRSCIRFFTTTIQKDYLEIISGVGCYSNVGRHGGAQVVSLQVGTRCTTVPVAIHELLHALGFEHEHNRPDRDKYIRINRDNIKPSDWKQFEKYQGQNKRYNLTEYDPQSIMHYDEFNDFGINKSVPVIKPKRNDIKIIGKAKTLTKLDQTKINELYNCASSDVEKEPIIEQSWMKAYTWGGVGTLAQWAYRCMFVGPEMDSRKVKGEWCSSVCLSTPSCTHFNWNNFQGGTCWMFSGNVNKVEAIPYEDEEWAVCGFLSVSGGVPEIRWQETEHGGKWAFQCDFIGGGFKSVRSRSEECSWLCQSNPPCNHFTFTDYEGGTCWMKSGSSSAEDAILALDAPVSVCGFLEPSTKPPTQIEWHDTGHGGKWAEQCNFVGGDFKNERSRGEDCSGLCQSNLPCTHFTYTDYNDGTCWMKSGSVSAKDAVPALDASLSVCGFLGPKAPSFEIEWKHDGGKGKWAFQCDFPGNDIVQHKVAGEKCGGLCHNIDGCTHFSHSNREGGTCILKSGPVSALNAVPKTDEPWAVCGYV